jgi:hypothetical protein
MAYSFSSPRISTIELALALDRLGPENGRSVLGVVCGDGRKRTPKKCGGTGTHTFAKGANVWGTRSEIVVSDGLLCFLLAMQPALKTAKGASLCKAEDMLRLAATQR